MVSLLENQNKNDQVIVIYCFSILNLSFAAAFKNQSC